MSITPLMQRIAEAKAYLLGELGTFPKISITLGSGLGGVLDAISIEREVSFDLIPHFHKTSVEGHLGRVVVGRLNGVRIAIIQGRNHYFEGHPMSETVFAPRVFASCGAEIFVLTNAAGGLRAEMTPSDLVLIKDHINLMGDNPLIGKNEPALGPRFPDLNNLYDPALREIFLGAARKLSLPIREGVYVAIHGPSFETPAEIRMYQVLGGDLVGMSTVPEAIALRHMGKRVLGISCVTNLAAGVTASVPTHEEVLVNAKLAYGRLTELLKEWVVGADKL